MDCITKGGSEKPGSIGPGSSGPGSTGPGSTGLGSTGPGPTGSEPLLPPLPAFVSGVVEPPPPPPQEICTSVSAASMNACQYFMPLPCAVGEFQRRILYKQAVCLQPDGGKCEPITESFINKRRGRPARKHAADLLHMPAAHACCTCLLALPVCSLFAVTYRLPLLARIALCFAILVYVNVKVT